MTYSQALGVIGYCLLPMTLIALILPFTTAFYYISLALKVGVASVECVKCVVNLFVPNSCQQIGFVLIHV